MSAMISFHSACRFFSQHRWEPDQLGLAVARLVVAGLLPPDAPIEVAFDDTLFRRWGRLVHHAFWTHDGAARGPVKLGRGNRWVIAGILVDLPFGDHRVCLPVLFRLWAGKAAPRRWSWRVSCSPCWAARSGTGCTAWVMPPTTERAVGRFFVEPPVERDDLGRCPGHDPTS